MTDGSVTMRSATPSLLRETAPYLLGFFALAAIYILTSPSNHSLSHDSYWYARMITQGSVGEVEHPRLFLWLASMQLLYGAAGLFTPDPDVYRLVGVANAIQAALAVMLFVRLAVRDLDLDRQSAWLAAGLMAFTYGLWRYSTEIEVYASVSLLSVLLLLGAFRITRLEAERRVAAVLLLALLGGFATLVYQPVGLLAGIAIPGFLLLSLGFRAALYYCLLSGVIVATGTWLASVLAAETVTHEGVDFILDTKAVGVRMPDLMTPAKLVHGLGYVVLSTNWILALEPIQEIFARIAPQRSYAAEIYAAEHAGPQIWVAFATIPAALLLIARIIWTAIRSRLGTRVSLVEATIWLWLVLHTAMIIAISPGTHEPWIPAFAAIFALVGRRLIMPVVSSGHSALVAGLLGVFVLHNAAAGMGVLVSRDGDYLNNRGAAALDLTQPGDLVIMSAHRPFAEYLRYHGMTNVIDIREDGFARAQNAVQAARVDGTKIWFLDDAVEPPRHVRAENGDLATAISEFSGKYIQASRREALADTGWIYPAEPTK